MTIKKDGVVELESISTMINKIMAYYGLDRLRFAEKYRFDPSQVTRWLNNGQQPRGEVYLRIRMEYDKVKNETMPILKQFEEKGAV